MLPDYAMIEPTTVCNLKCISCFRDEMIEDEQISVGSFSISDLEKIHKQLPELKHIRFHGMGELFILKNHVKIIEKLRELYPNAWIELVTNGQYKKTDAQKIATLVDRITFSMSGADKKSYEEHHVGGNWERFIENITEFVQFKERISLEVNYVCMVSNSKNLLPALNVCKQLGVETLRINLYQDWSGKDNLSMSVADENIIDIKDLIHQGNLIGVEVHLMGNPDFKASECQWMDKRILISYNGEVLPCCMRPDHKLNLGNIFDEDIDSIWTSNKIETLRNARVNNELDFCENCPYVENVNILKECL